MSQSTTGKTPLPHPLPPGDDLSSLVGDRVGAYELGLYIGEGPTGVVFRCVDLLGNALVIKLMHPELSSPRASTALSSDLERLRDRPSPHIHAPLDFGATEDGRLFTVAAPLPGRDLSEELAAVGRMAPRRAVEVIRQVCFAIEAAHAIGVVHGGIKPRNVFLVQHPGEAEQISVLDFGSARLGQGQGGAVILGDPRYMAPEQFGGSAGERTDVYALGLLLHELCEGAPPFVGPHGKVMMKQIQATPKPPAGAHVDLVALLDRALQKEPSDRFPTVRQLREAIERWSAAAALASAASFHIIVKSTEERARREPSRTEESPSNAASNANAMEKKHVSQLVEINKRTLSAAPPLPDPPKASNGQSDSVEASLEDFISQANKSFQEPAEGWTLNTDEVELVSEADLAPIQPAKIAAAIKAPAVIAKSKSSPAANVPAPAEPRRRDTKPGIPMGGLAMPAAPPSAPVEVAAETDAGELIEEADDDLISDDLETAAAAPVAALEIAAMSTAPVTERALDAAPAPLPIAPVESAPVVAAAPIAAAPMAAKPSAPVAFATAAPATAAPPMTSGPIASSPATSNPIVLFSVIFGAFILGAVVVLVLIKFVMVQPQVQPLPTTAAPIAEPAATPTAAVAKPAAAPPSAPVVTPIVPSAPIVTPIATPPSAPPPVEAKQPSHHKSSHPAGHIAAKPKAAEPRPAREKAVAKPAAAPPVKEKPAAKPAKGKDKGGGDWVDPF